MRNPVCRLRLALYGHPDSGGYWESHCREKLRGQGFEDVEDWPSVYWHPVLKALLVV